MCCKQPVWWNRWKGQTSSPSSSPRAVCLCRFMMQFFTFSRNWDRRTMALWVNHTAEALNDSFFLHINFLSPTLFFFFQDLFCDTKMWPGGVAFFPIHAIFNLSSPFARFTALHWLPLSPPLSFTRREWATLTWRPVARETQGSVALATSFLWYGIMRWPGIRHCGSLAVWCGVFEMAEGGGWVGECNAGLMRVCIYGIPEREQRTSGRLGVKRNFWKGKYNICQSFVNNVTTKKRTCCYIQTEGQL